MRIGSSCISCEFFGGEGGVELIIIGGSRYHQLNHMAIFGGGYRGGAVASMRMLIGKYAAD